MEEREMGENKEEGRRTAAGPVFWGLGSSDEMWMDFVNQYPIQCWIKGRECWIKGRERSWTQGYVGS